MSHELATLLPERNLSQYLEARTAAATAFDREFDCSSSPKTLLKGHMLCITWVSATTSETSPDA